jgi:hypothetical protein
MANTKISALTSATTPLAGTETLPVVQSSATTKVTVANLTAGRAVSVLSLNVNTTYSGAPVQIASAPGGSDLSAAGINVMGTAEITNGQIMNGVSFTPLVNTNRARAAIGCLVTTNWGYGSLVFYTRGNADASVLTSADEKMRIAFGGDITVSVGNLIQGTAAKGMNFTANTPLAGMTSQLLNWYEEGTFTPNQGAGLTLVGAFSSTGKYTRIGRQVSISGTVTGATSVAVTAAGVITSNLPFTVSTAGHGNATNAAVTASATVICTSTSVTSAAAIAATGTITFSATYFV